MSSPFWHLMDVDAAWFLVPLEHLCKLDLNFLLFTYHVAAPIQLNVCWIIANDVHSQAATHSFHQWVLSKDERNLARHVYDAKRIMHHAREAAAGGSCQGSSCRRIVSLAINRTSPFLWPPILLLLATSSHLVVGNFRSCQSCCCYLIIFIIWR